MTLLSCAVFANTLEQNTHKSFKSFKLKISFLVIVPVLANVVSSH